MMEIKENRLLSLDVFRGITIAAMILVNSPGTWDHVYPALLHAEWNGCTPTDLIFPFFLFIVGVAITISLGKRKERGDAHKKIIMQVIRRSLLLILLGIIKDNFPFYDFAALQIPGVLQRIGLVYFFTSVIFLKTTVKVQAAWGAALLILYWFLMTMVPVPGIGYASLEPSSNLGAYIDRLLLDGHLWYKTKTWDPSSLLGTLPSVSSAICGVLAGHWLRSDNNPSVKTVWMFTFGNIGLVTGIIWDIWFPINKNLWTSSYVIYTAGMALNFFAFCYWIIDVQGIKWWTKPFVIYGMNAIAAYFFSSILGRILKNLLFAENSEGVQVNMRRYLYEIICIPYFSPVNASLAWAILTVLLWLSILWILYKKKIFIKI
jgi:predicted acyltransferase